MAKPGLRLEIDIANRPVTFYKSTSGYLSARVPILDYFRVADDPLGTALASHNPVFG
jgi:hypothetical protein